MEQNYYISDDEASRRLGIKRSSVCRLLREHKADFEEFGEIKYHKTRPLNGSPEKYYLLTTKQQWVLLVMYSKPNEKTRKVKKEIVLQLTEEMKAC